MNLGVTFVALISLSKSPICLTLRLLMSYIWSAYSWCFYLTHNDAAQSLGLLWTSDQLVAETST